MLTSHRLGKVRADAGQIEQIVMNLVVNAMDAMSGIPRAQRRVTVSSACDGNSANVSVSDVGPGIRPEKLKEVFEPFFTTKPQGMGMGLSIARSIVEAHGGQLLAGNNAAGGANFQIRLPLASASE